MQNFKRKEQGNPLKKGLFYITKQPQQAILENVRASKYRLLSFIPMSELILG